MDLDRSEYFTNRSEYYRKRLGELTNNLQNLRVVYTKISRDYVPFYKGLSSLYKAGPNKKAADEALRTVERTLALLGEIIRGDSITSQDTSTLYSLIGDIEKSRRYFIEQAATTQALQDRIEKVTAETGVSLDDLSVTLGLVEKAVSRDVRSGYGHALTSAGRLFPKTRETISRVVGGVGAAVAGPFTPFLHMGMEVGRDILGATSSVGRMIQEIRQSRFAAQLRPISRDISESDLNRLAASREQPPAVSAFYGTRDRQVSIEEQTQPLYHFFEKGAYKAKWTKELLQSMREATKGKKDINLLDSGGLVEQFKNMSLAIMPFIGKAGLYAGLAAGLGLSIRKFGELNISIGDFVDAQKNRQKSADELARVTKDKLKVLKEMGTEEYARRAGLSVGQVAVGIAIQEERAAMEKWAARPWWQKMGERAGILEKTQPKLQPFYERVEEIKGLGPARGPESTQQTIPAEMMPPQIPGLIDLDATIKELIQEMRKDKVGTIPSAGLGNPYDSGNPLLGFHADGDLTLGE